MNEKQGRGVVSNIKALSARRVDSIVGCGGGGFFLFFVFCFLFFVFCFLVLFGSRDAIFGADSMLAPLRYTIDMNDALPRCSAPWRATKGVNGILGDGFGS